MQAPRSNQKVESAVLVPLFRGLNRKQGMLWY